MNQPNPLARRVACWLALCSTVAATLAMDLPSVDSGNSGWKLDDGVRAENGAFVVTGDADKYVRARLTVPAAPLRGGSFLFRGEVRTEALKLGDTSYQAPKLKVYDDKGKALGVNNLHEERPEWSSLLVQFKVPADYAADTITFEVGMQQCPGTFSARNLELCSGEWRWRRLDGTNKSYFDK
ncbi:MAG: hypothetical protein A3K19_27430 [Lentisphaerae bacterium RIFOXYB12_FULL_65_16]|nr:MAG: hypothetical protein A3K18_06275 [Lentisphaerae bacterium RIFOXYA12_64_32]OGV86444.1 MAG: hypothetical protein A3K19_27430 [Lentisphaerae bacterium RIFOXYB12_FULL_65_16]